LQPPPSWTIFLVYEVYLRKWTVRAQWKWDAAQKGGLAMKLEEVREKAKAMGVETSGKKADLILAIQKAEGYEACFGSKDTCDQMDCCWREDCLPKTAKA